MIIAGVPVVCRPKVAERDFCANRTSDSVRVKNCSLNTACTSDCKCFNGQTENVANTDEFRGYGIDEQGIYIGTHCDAEVGGGEGGIN